MITTYAKLNGTNLDTLTRIPNVANASEAALRSYALSHGYKEVVYTNSPGEWYTPSFELIDNKIKQVWTPFSLVQKFSVIQANIQALLDRTAAEKNYDNIFTALTYLNSTNPTFKAEAEALRDWRDDIWTRCYAYLADVEAGKEEMPSSWTEVEEKLPKFTWPS